MQTDSSKTSAVLDDVAEQPNARPAVEIRSKGLEYFLKFLVIGSAIILGAFAALIIGLFTGWIPFVC